MSQNTVIALLPILKKAGYYAPDRNFLPFDGKPMYQFMIAKLFAIPRIERIVINTDSDEVKAFCKSNNKITVIDRPEALTIEDTPSDMITAYDLERVTGEHFIEVQSFNPIITKYTIETVITQYFEYIVNVEEQYFDSLFTEQRYEMRNYDLDKRELNNEYQFVIFENRILHLFNRTTFRKQGNRKIGKMAMLYEVQAGENLLVDSNTNYELAKLVYANRDKFPDIFHSGV